MRWRKRLGWRTSQCYEDEEQEKKEENEEQEKEKV